MSRIHHLTHLAEMMGDETTETEATVMRDILVGLDLLDWDGDRQGGHLADLDEARWEHLVYLAVDAAREVQP